MNEDDILKIINKIFKYTINKNNKLTINELFNKYAFDIKLPNKVKDSITNEETWSNYSNNKSFITLNNMEKIDIEKGWMLEKQNITSLKEIIEIWDSINYITTERVYDSLNVKESDTIYRSENIYRSTDCSDSKNLIFCNSCHDCEYLLASNRSITCTFCIKVDDSKDCSNSYHITCSNKISNSIFIQDCYNLYECIFCSHIANKKYCIANMQFKEEEYYKIKDQITEWIINS